MAGDTAAASVEVNRDILRWIILIGSAPVWWPVAKILWRDFNGALREEGGLLGSQPSAREVTEILEEKKGEPETLVSEPWVAPGQVKQPRLRGRNAAPPGAQTGRAPGGRPRPGGRRGFR